MHPGADIPSPANAAATSTRGEPTSIGHRPVHVASAPVRQVPKSVLKTVIESAILMLSVLLGFALQAHHERQREAVATVDVVENFRRELTQNVADLRDGHRRQLLVLERLSTLDTAEARNATAIELVKRAMPKGGLRLPALSDAAWQTALATDGLRLLDYRLASLLSETYLIQHESVGASARMVQDRLFDRSSFERTNTNANVQLLAVLLQQLTAQEEMLIDTSSAALAKLPKQRATTEAPR